MYRIWSIIQNLFNSDYSSSFFNSISFFMLVFDVDIMESQQMTYYRVPYIQSNLELIILSSCSTDYISIIHCRVTERNPHIASTSHANTIKNVCHFNPR